ncbi:MAG: universal stress protein [Syntrophomonas sp.]|nr:universal stress protein [Syntrophomonas sp.]
MKNGSTFLNEKILVCVNYGPTAERLIRRGGDMAARLDCPLYVLTIDPLPYEEMDAERTDYLDRWQELAGEYNAVEYIIKVKEKRSVAKVIAQVATEKQITQVFMGQTAQSRWQEISKGSIVNILLREIPFADLHLISMSRNLDEIKGYFEKGVRAYLVREQDTYRLCFNPGDNVALEGIFYKETGTDFNNGIFTCKHDCSAQHFHIVDDYVTDQNAHITGSGSLCETWDEER